MRRFVLICLLLFFAGCLPKRTSLCAYGNPEQTAKLDLKLGGVLYNLSSG